MSFQTDLYDSMLADVISLSNRPDLEEEAAIALRAATTNAHLTDAYPRDVVQTHVQIPNQAYQVALDIPTLFPQMRGISQVRPTDSLGNLIDPTSLRRIDIVEIGDVYDPEYGNIKNNIAYMSGDKVIVRNSINCQGYVVEWVKSPKTRREEYDSWIAQQMPTIIIMWATSFLFNTNGNEEKARSYLTQIEKFYIPQLKSNYLTGAQR